MLVLSLVRNASRRDPGVLNTRMCASLPKHNVPNTRKYVRKPKANAQRNLRNAQNTSTSVTSRNIYTRKVQKFAKKSALITKPSVPNMTRFVVSMAKNVSKMGRCAPSTRRNVWNMNRHVRNTIKCVPKKAKSALSTKTNVLSTKTSALRKSRNVLNLARNVYCSQASVQGLIRSVFKPRKYVWNMTRSAHSTIRNVSNLSLNVLVMAISAQRKVPGVWLLTNSVLTTKPYVPRAPVISIIPPSIEIH
eukprot:TRINITY_DN990_c0_g2_i7.p2 TRINITY_DN990_c0_g2~~TRINITY_DN990_c0_g2_i7.p2  ORF type:complete len:248 (+),score=-10.25 TRINITY_DN990_c0_g2_i7:277-1020(+)